MFDCAKESQNLLRRYSRSRNQIVNTRKMLVRNTFVSLLVYNRVFPPLSKNESKFIDHGRTKKMKVVVQELYEVDEMRERNTSRWWKSPCKEICADKVQNVARKEMKLDDVHKLFSHDATRMTLLKFCWYQIREGDAETILSFIRVDTIFSDAVDSLKIGLDGSVDNIVEMDPVEHEMGLQDDEWQQPLPQLKNFLSLKRRKFHKQMC